MPIEFKVPAAVDGRELSDLHRGELVRPADCFGRIFREPGCVEEFGA